MLLMVGSLTSCGTNPKMIVMCIATEPHPLCAIFFLNPKTHLSRRSRGNTGHINTQPSEPRRYTPTIKANHGGVLTCAAAERMHIVDSRRRGMATKAVSVGNGKVNHSAYLVGRCGVPHPPWYPDQAPTSICNSERKPALARRAVHCAENTRYIDSYSHKPSPFLAVGVTSYRT